MRIGLLRYLLLMLAFTGCKKDDLDPQGLTTNPFDPDYDGAAIFTELDERTVPYTIGGETRLRLELDVRVERALLPSTSSYGVSYRPPGVSTSVVVPAADLVDDRFTLSVLDVIPGTTYCTQVNLTNAGGAGGGNALCGTAE